MNIRQLNEKLEKFIEKEVSVNLIPDSNDPEVVDKWMKKSFGSKNRIKKNIGSQTLNKIKAFIDKNNDLNSTVIGSEFLDEDIIESDKDTLYFNGSESIPNNVRINLTNLCKQLIINALQDKDINIGQIKKQLISSLDQIIASIDADENIKISDDATQSAVQSLYVIPILIKEFCDALNTPICKQISNFISSNNIFEQAIEKADSLMEALN